MSERRKHRIRTSRRYGYGGVAWWGWGLGGYGQPPEEERDDLTMTSNLGEQFDGFDGGGGDSGGGE